MTSERAATDQPREGETGRFQLCGCLEREQCPGCGVCTNCDGCFCGED